MENVYLGRQPILDIDGNLNSYEILYREGHDPKKALVTVSSVRL